MIRLLRVFVDFKIL